MTDMQKLQTLLNFTDDDLAYNRRGERSPAQTKAKANTEQGCMRTIVIIFLISVAAIILGFTAFTGSERDGIVFVGGVFAVLTFLCILLMRTPSKGADQVHKVTGEARLHVDRGESGKRYILMIDKVDFSVLSAVYDELEQGATYTAYYTSVSTMHNLLSLERS